jgi:hypothetical protein
LQEAEQLIAEDELPDAAEIVTEPAPEMLTGIETFDAVVSCFPTRKRNHHPEHAADRTHE